MGNGKEPTLRLGATFAADPVSAYSQWFEVTDADGQKSGYVVAQRRRDEKWYWASWSPEPGVFNSPSDPFDTPEEALENLQHRGGRDDHD